MPLFWFLAFALAWAITVPAALSVHGVAGLPAIPQGATHLIGFAPAIAAFIAAPFTGDFKAFARRVFTLRAPLWAYVLAPVLPLLLLAMPFLWAHHQGTEPPKLSLSPQLLVFAGIWFVLALGEEIGWRGYALPKLMERHGFWPGATILGLVWTVWHYPLLLASPYATSPAEIAHWLGLFSLQIFLANFLICWLMVRSGAVIVPALFHTMFNVIATAYYAAAIDFAITGAMAALVALILIFDRNPKFPARGSTP